MCGNETRRAAYNARHREFKYNPRPSLSSPTSKSRRDEASPSPLTSAIFSTRGSKKGGSTT